MKNFFYLNKILTIVQKKRFIFLTILIFASMLLEILTLNSMLILLSYMTDPSSITDSNFFIYMKNLNLSYDLNLVVIVIFICFFIMKTLFNIFINWKQNKFIHND